MNDPDPDVRSGTAQALGELAKIFPEKAIPLYEKGMNDSIPGVKLATAQALGELAKISPEKAIPLYEKGMNDSIPGVRYATAQALGELAKTSPEKFISLYEKGIKDSDSVVRRGTAKALGELAKKRDFKNEERIYKILKEKYKIKETEISYCYQIIIELLKQKQDPGTLLKDYLPKYLSIKKIAQEVNDNIEETKKWQNPEEFFDKYNFEITDLHLIDPNLSTQLLKNHIFRGLSFIESYINVFKPVLKNPEITQSIKEYIQTNKNLDGYNLSDLLEIASAYHNFNQTETFKEILSLKIKNFQELKSELNKNLLKKVAESLNIEANISEQEISQWKIKYFANLITNQEIIKKQGDEDKLEIYNSVLRSIFENRFNEFITNLEQKDEIGREIAKHNQKVEKEFKKAGIDWNNWLNFKEKVIMTISTQKKQDREALFNQFKSRFEEWQEKINQLESSLRQYLENNFALESSLKQSLEKDLKLISSLKQSFEKAQEIGREIAKRGLVLVTGATTGLPYWAAKGAKSEGGLVIGLSPAASKLAHVKVYKLPLDYHDLIIYTGFNYAGRNLLLTRSADAVITICGRVGTLNEFTIAFEEEKPIGVLTNSGGIADEIENILKKSHRGMAKVVFSDNPQELIDALINLILEEQKNTL